MQAERRKYRRFQVKDNAFAVISSEPIKLVPVINISQGGLGVYLNDGAECLKRSSKLEILVADCSFYLENLPFKIISNFRAFPDNSSNIFDGRCYSLKFGNLSTSQNSRVRYFIQNYTEGGSTPRFLRRLNKIMRHFWANKYSEESCDARILQGLHRPLTWLVPAEHRFFSTPLNQPQTQLFGRWPWFVINR